MKIGGLPEIMGKTIKSVVFSVDNPSPPIEQLFQVFTDGSTFEFYGELFSPGGGVYKYSEEQVIETAGCRGGKVFHIK